MGSLNDSPHAPSHNWRDESQDNVRTSGLEGPCDMVLASNGVACLPFELTGPVLQRGPKCPKAMAALLELWADWLLRAAQVGHTVGPWQSKRHEPPLTMRLNHEHP